MEGYRITVPQITSIETAVRIYYEYNAIGNKQICELFGCCLAKAQQLKKPVAAAMLEKGMYLRGNGTVNVEVAYEVWGLDIQNLERKLTRARKLGFAQAQPDTEYLKGFPA